MAEEKKKSDHTLWMLGAAITLPMILLCGPIAGFAISHYILVKILGGPSVLVPIFVGLGFLASGMQAYRLIKRIRDLDADNSKS